MSDSNPDGSGSAGSGESWQAPAGVALVGFGASWCAPWVLLQPQLDRLARAGHTVVRVDVDTDPDAATRYGVLSVPTFCITVDGRERRRVLGAVSADELAALLGRTRQS